MMKSLVTVILSLWPGLTLAEWATQTPFTIPMANEDKASGLFLDQTTLLVAKPGQPPVIDIYRVTPTDSPQPQPGPKPEPDPQPQPMPRGPLHLFWIEETAERTPQQAAALTDKAIREALARAGWTLRVADDDVVDEDGKPPPELAPYIQAARRDGMPRLFAVDPAGAEIYAGKAPDDTEQYRQLLHKLGLTIEANDRPPEAQTTPADKQKDCPNGNCPIPSTPRTRWRVFR